MSVCSNGFYYTKFSIQGHQVHRKLNTKDLNEAKMLEADLKADLFKNIQLGNIPQEIKYDIAEIKN